MSRPTVEVADTLHAQGDRFVEKNRSWLGIQRLSVLRAITRCHTAALGGHIDHCPRCGHQASVITPDAIGIAPSARRKRANAGSPPAKKKCSACPAFLWYSPSRMS